MQDSPFFSIVVPTKNRSYLIDGTISSILKQTYKDFELIIADNDDTENTKKVIEKYTDSRLRYYKTGNLSMPDNWEFGSLKACGQYLIMFEDKITLKHNALSRLNYIIEAENPDSISWPYDSFYDVPGIYLYNKTCDGEYSVLSKQGLLNELMKSNIDYFHRYAPTGAKSCIRMKLVDAIRHRNRRLCLPVAPDNTMAFQSLCFGKKFLHLNEALTVVRFKDFNGNDSYGNGRGVFLKTDLGNQFFKELNIKREDYIKKTPIKAFTIVGCFLEDFFLMQDIYKEELSEFKLDIPSFFVLVYDETIRRERANVNIQEEFEAWEKALKEQPASVQNEILMRIRKLKLKRAKYKLSVFMEKFNGYNALREKAIRKTLMGHGLKFDSINHCLDNI